VLKRKQKWITNQHVIKRDRKCTVNSCRPKRQKLLMITFTVRQANTHNCTHRTHPEMSACLIFWDLSVTQTDQPNFRPDNTHFTRPKSTRPADISDSGWNRIRGRCQTWRCLRPVIRHRRRSSPCRRCDGDDRWRPQTHLWYCLRPRIQSQSDVCVERKEN